MKFLLIAVLAILAFASSVLADFIPLEPGAWKTHIEVPAQAFSAMYALTIGPNTREVIVQMKKDATDTASDPDLYVKWDAAPSRNDYDAADFSTNPLHTASVIVPKDNRPTQLIIGVFGFNGTPGIVQIIANNYDCPNMNCGYSTDASKSAGTCDAATGTCTCNPKWTAHPDCSAETVDADFVDGRTRTIPKGQIIYFKYDAPKVAIEGAGHMTFSVKRDVPEGIFTGMIAHNRIPTYDDNVDITYGYYTQRELILRVGGPSYVDGAWYVGVEAPTRYAMTFTITAEFSACPNNCSGNGVCKAETATCECKEGYTALPDCSIHSTALDPKLPQDIAIAAYANLVFTADVNKFYSTGPFELGFQLTAKDVPEGTVGFPRMYLKYNAVPSDDNFDVTAPRPSKPENAIYVPASELKEGKYHLLISNLNSHELTYNLRMVYSPHCPTHCSQHGRCNELGRCLCDEGFTGNDCTISRGDCIALADAKKGVEIPVVIFLFVFFGLAALAVTLFVAKKFFFVPTQASPELNYDQLSA